MGERGKTRVLFHRRFLTATAGINGGNLKLKDCFDHVAHSEKYQAEVYFSPDSIWSEHAGNHWLELRKKGLKQWKIQAGDILFFAGGDWRVLTNAEKLNPPVPVINITHPRHTRPEDPRNNFLKFPAIRIAKSETGAKILEEYGVNGPIVVIPDAIDLGLLPELPEEKDIDILVIGRKEPDLAKRVYRKLKWQNRFRKKKLNIAIQLPPPLPTRLDFLNLLSRAKIAVCIPLQEDRGFEGFYLPALEAMALETLVVCPHAVGNVDHCIDGYNCIVPAFTERGLLKGVRKMMNLSSEEKANLIQNGLLTADKHQIEKERAAILQLLDRAYDLWTKSELFDKTIE
ncbi:MAG: glycosyltransferase [Saprospiraceae bacterium]|nr:glycosyltransferase [Saprospiraceae bacterium]